jgi:5-amino-6-(5-phosphoribosylamino)uracil reductase/diaminohydroxyphosphoribosylaminopyrimidine deaminase/5-amino-6-(5-phosphoribosylamino)uracil reductase
VLVRSRPLVTLHLAQSLDGRIGLDGATTPLSTSEGRMCAHTARAAHDAVLVGASTVRIDDPRLTVREVTGEHPLRVVLASALALPRGAKVLARDGRALVIGAEGRVLEEERRALESAGVAVAIAPAEADGRVSVDGALAILAQRGVRTLLVEGGSKVVTSFLGAKRVDRLCVEIAMRLLGAPGTPMVGAIEVGAFAEAPSLANVSVERLGENVLVRGDVVYG